MGYTPRAENTAIEAVKNAATWVSLHTGDPGTNAANEVSGGTYARKQTAWPTNGTDGVVVGTPAQLDIPAGTHLTHWALHSSATGTASQFYSGLLAAPEDFGSAGTYSLTPTLEAINPPN